MMLEIALIKAVLGLEGAPNNIWNWVIQTGCACKTSVRDLLAWGLNSRNIQKA